MIDPTQLRAARAMLNWKTADLAKKTGLTINTINSIEREVVMGRKDTLEKIQAAFEAAGLEFLPDSGVRKQNHIVVTYDGDDCLSQLHADVYETLRDTQGEMLIAHLDEGDAARSMNPEVIQEIIRKRKEAGITCRLLVRANDPYLLPPYHTYRTIPEAQFSPYPFYIYGSKLALVSWKPTPKVIIINDEHFAESARKLFNLVWHNVAEVIKEP